MQKTVFTCDKCGVEKKESNHWFRGLSWTASVGDAVKEFVLIPWNGQPSVAEPEHFTEAHYCGIACATKAMVAYFTEECRP